MKKILYGAICASLFFSTSCNDFLEVEPNNQLAVEDFYETDSDASQAIMSAYDVLQWHENIWGGGWSSPYMVRTLPSDDGQAGGSGPGDQPSYVVLDRMTFDATNAPIAAAWGTNYYGIYRCNLILNNVAPETDLKSRIIEEARALRAYFYFDLVSLFGDVPLITENLVPEEYNQSRTPKSEVYAFIESELNLAIERLPAKSAYSMSDKFRMSKGTAQAVLGKALLYQEKWSESANIFDDMIASNEYGLEPDFRSVFTAEAELGAESVFEVVYINSNGYNWGTYPWSTAAESNIHIQLMGARESAFTGVDSLNNGWGFNYPSEKLWNAFMSEGDEARRKNTVMSEQEFLDAGGEISEENVFDYQGFLRRKYGAYSTETSAEGVYQVNYGTNWRLIRYADVLLMAAEAHFQAGNEGQAKEELNKVRTRAQLSEITAGGTELFEAIVKERQLELALEGHRYLDLVRWGRAADEIEGFTPNKHEVFPIPQNELLTASNMTQNPGY